MIKPGCCGFPVSQREYYRRLSTVEVSEAFYKPPKPETAERWRREAPEDFEFSLRAWLRITHPAASQAYARGGLPAPARERAGLGHFRSTDQVREAWERVRAVAEALRPRFIVFQTPTTFYPNADHLRDMYRFFKEARRGGALFVWEPRARWEDKLAARVCADLGLLRAGAAEGAVRYLRLRPEGGSSYARELAEEDFRAAADRAAGAKSAYVFLNNAGMWRDVRRFQEFLEPAWRPRPRREP